MKQANEIWKKHKPRKGDVVHYRGKQVGIVTSVEGNLCWTKYDDRSASEPFIWCFSDKLNALHDWPAKDQAPACPYCNQTDDLRECGEITPGVQDYICEDCFTPTDTGPCFDDLPEVEQS